MENKLNKFRAYILSGIACDILIATGKYN